ncbi:MAG: DUF2083 domain-containing protein [Alphaproteobacteria bacterium]|nr:DUF2083 domain-containing protein [Alphaproteobacteria bacterium]
MERKVMLGHKIRRLRRDVDLTQAQMAERMGISPSYFNLIENNQRPVTVNLLLKLGQAFDLDLQSFADTDEARLVTQLTEVFGDPVFRAGEINRHELREMAAVAPTLAQAVLDLYDAYQEAHDAARGLAERVADRDKLQVMHAKAFPLEEVRDFFHSNENHFPELETAAERLWQSAGLEAGELWRGLVEHLQCVHHVKVKRLPAEVMVGAIRRFDRHANRLMLSEVLSASGRLFHLAVTICLTEQGAILDRLVDGAGLAGEARELARTGLASYYAGAVLMPYERFVQAARGLRFDIELLQHRFDASFEQVCHRLTTLQRPSARGVPFFMIRVDKAGNVSKRFSATPLQFARFGGACPRWNVYDAFRAPGVLHPQLAAMPDGTPYFFIARTVTKPGGGWRNPPQQFALALGCEASHAASLIYADGLDVKNTDAAVPIGVNCRLCERLECSQRAYPPLNHRLIVDETVRGVSAFQFTPASRG